MLGGDTFFEHNSDVIDELGDHQYFAKFVFGSENYCFCRSTSTPHEVSRCTEGYEPIETISIQQYRSFLSEHYGLESLGLGFRSLTSPFFRVWGKQNLDPNRPLDGHKKATALDALKLALSLFKRHASLASLERELATESEKKRALRNAQTEEIVPNIGLQKYKENAKIIVKIDTEIDEIKEQLKRYATNIQQIVSREALDLKQAKDRLLEAKAGVLSRLRRIERSLKTNSYIKSKTFSLVKEFFPDINTEKLADIEEFHSSITRILRKELQDSRKTMEGNLMLLDAQIADLDMKLAGLLRNVDNPTVIIDRVQSLTNRKSSMHMENHFRERSLDLSTTVSVLKKSVEDERSKQLQIIEQRINSELLRISSKIYGPDSKSPYVQFTVSNYSYEIFEDTGTGRAYSNLAIFDLTLLRTSALPLIAHDSPIFKNVENDVVAHLVQEYSKETKQVFIAIDEISKYDQAASRTIGQHAVIKLSNSEVLYDKNWRKKATS